MKSTLTVPSFKALLLSSSSIFLGAFFFTTLLSSLFSIQAGVEENAAELLGGDVKVSANAPFTDEQRSILLEVGSSAAVSFVDTFTGMVISEKAETLTSVLVVDDAYPLYGSLTMTEGAFLTPSTSEIFLEDTFRTDESVALNDPIQIGEGRYKVAGFFESTPDTQSAFSFFGVKAVVSRAGFEATQINLAQNRSNHIALFRAPDNAKAISQQLREIFPKRAARIDNVEDGGGTAGQIFTEVQKVATTFIALITLLFATSFFMGVYFYIQSQTKTIAVIKSLGMPLNEILKKYVLSVGVIWSSIGLLGVMIGIVLIYLFAPVLTETFGQPLSLSVREIFTSITLAITLPVVALLLLVRNIFALSPSILLKGSDTNDQKIPLGTLVKKLKFWKGMGFVGLLIFPFFVLLGYIAQNALFPLFFFGGVLVLFLVLSSILWIFFQALKKIKRRFPFSTKLILSFVTEPGRKKFFILGGFFALFLVIGTTAILQKSFLENLQTLSGDDAPSAFFLDIKNEQVEGLEKILSTDGRVAVFPIIRARIQSLDGMILDENTSGEIRRPFNINFTDTFSTGEKIISGSLWPTDTDENWVSVESDFAERQNVEVGAEIIFDVLGKDITFTVASIRKLEQRDFNPWFIFTFPKNAVKAAPKSYIGFWWSDDEFTVSTQKSQVIRTFPNISAIETSAVRKTITELSKSISLAIFGVSLILIFSGSITLFSFLTEVEKSRKKPKKMLLQIGVTKPLLSKVFLGEMLCLLLFPFLFSLILAVGIVWCLSFFFFDFTEVALSWLPFIFFGGMVFVLFLRHLFLVKLKP